MKFETGNNSQRVQEPLPPKLKITEEEIEPVQRISLFSYRKRRVRGCRVEWFWTPEKFPNALQKFAKGVRKQIGELREFDYEEIHLYLLPTILEGKKETLIGAQFGGESWVGPLVNIPKPSVEKIKTFKKEIESRANSQT